MKLFKLTAFASLLFAFVLSSCEKNAEKKINTDYSKTNIPMSYTQLYPVGFPSAALGSMDVFYSKETRILSYTIRWSGLSDSVISIRINGLAPAGFANLRAGYSPTSLTADTTSPYVVYQQIAGSLLNSANTTTVTSTKKLPATGTFSGTLLVDGVVVKETDLLNGLFYVTVSPKTTLPGTPPGSLYYRWYGEIRGQIIFQ